MDAPGKTCQRLLAALEQLVAEEQCLVRTGEIEQIRTVQQRADSVIMTLVELWGASGAAGEIDPLRPRLVALQARRAATIKTMNSRLAEMRAKLSALDTARLRLGKMRRAYGPRREASRLATGRFNFAA
jgi:hypothetical protein